MTREEEIKKQADIYTDNASNYTEWSDDGGWSCTSDIELVEKAFIEGAKWADAHPKSPWISTDKYLPKQGGHYLCNDGNNHISMLAFCGDKWVNSRTFDDIPLEAVKYWMFPPRLP